MTAMSAVLYSVGVDSSLIYRLLMETDSGNCKFANGSYEKSVIY